MRFSQRLWNLALVLDVAALALICFGNVKRGETISSALWSLELDGKWMGKTFRPLVDRLANRFEKNHCQSSYDYFCRVEKAMLEATV